MERVKYFHVQQWIKYTWQLVKSLGEAAQSTTRWIEKMPWSSEMEQQELGKVIHNSKTTEHFNHSLLLCCSQPYFTAICTRVKWVQDVIQTLFHTPFCWYQLPLQGVRLIQLQFCSSHKPWGQWECNFTKVYSIKLYFTQNLTFEKKQKRKGLSCIINIISETVHIFLL